MNLWVRTALCVCMLAGLAGAGELADLDGALAKTKAYKEGESRAALAAAQALIRELAKSPANRAGIEKSLLALLQSDATQDAKAFACGELSIFGSPASVPALAKLLGDDKLSHYARTALARMPGPEAARALRSGLGTVKGAALLGVIDSVGERGDAGAVPALQKLVAGETAGAAIAALGKIGTPEAAQALAQARASVPAALRLTLGDAWLLCADSLMAQGKKKDAAAIYKTVYDSEKIEPLRVAAFRGLLATGEKTALDVILKNLGSDDARMRSVAAGFARDMAGAEATKAFAAALPGLPPDAQVLLLGALAARGDAAALPAVTAAAKGKEDAVRVAALKALGALGDGSTVPLLAAMAATAKGAEQSAARNSLVQLRAKGADAALLAAMGQGETGARVECIRALAERGAPAAEGPMIALVGSDDATLRYEAIKALSTLATPKALPSLVGFLGKTESSKERRGLEKSIAKLLTRMDDREAAAPQFLAALPKASAKAKPALVRLLGRVESRAALDAIRKLTADGDADVADAAIRTLVEWPDAAPIEDVLAIARTGKTPVHKILAVRGVVRMAGLPSDRKPEQTVDMLAQALKAAARPDEKKQVIAALANVHHIRSLGLALGCIADPALEAEAATTVVGLAKIVRKTHPDEAKAAVQKVAEEAKGEQARRIAEAALIVIDTALNIAPTGKATSPDGIEKDGAAGGDQAAIDGNPNTYWDEADGQKLYRLLVTFKQPERIAAISILGFQHHQYAPKDFDVLCDGKVVKTVKGATYENNLLMLPLGNITCTTVELKITGYYGASPAIRELGIYPPSGKLPKGK